MSTPAAGNYVDDSAITASLIQVCHAIRPSHRPIWFMRQAGRSLPEYRRIRENVPMLEACQRPELIAEITMQPVARHDVDGAIIFSDIMIPVLAAGVGVDIVPGVGPVIAEPIISVEQVRRLRSLEPEAVGFIAEAIKLVAAQLNTQVPATKAVIGFAGAPFTVASYLIEGGPSRTHERTKQVMYTQPQLWKELLNWLVEITVTFLQVQIGAGAGVIQLFDSWAGTLSVMDYQRYVYPYSRAVLERIRIVPRIHFGVGAGHLASAMAECGSEVLGADWRVPVDCVARQVGKPIIMQGNIDPVILLSDWDTVKHHVETVLEAGDRTIGHIVNLGHGVLPNTDPDVLTRVVDLVHSSQLAD